MSTSLSPAESFQSTIKARIKDRLSACGLSMHTASVMAGLGRTAVRDIISGKSKSPQVSTLVALTGPLKCSLSYLQGFDGIEASVLTPAYDAFAGLPESKGTADPLDAIRDDLGDANGLLIALNELASSQGTDSGEAIASVARCALEKVRRAYRSVSDVWEAQS